MTTPNKYRSQAIVLLVVALTTGSIQQTGKQAAAQSTSHTFTETGKTVTGTFLRYWNSHGGLAQQGYPISAELQEGSDTDGKSYTVQYFERAVFELHPQNPAPNDVLLSLLGDFLYKQNYPNGAANQQPNNLPGSVLFPETGKRLGGPFLEYWQAHGGPAQQGYPVSEELTETSRLDGKQYRVQYFERAEMEYHPQNKPPNDVLLAQLGTFRYRAKYGEPTLAPTSQSAVAGRTEQIASGFGSPDDLVVAPSGDILFGDFGNRAVNILKAGAGAPLPLAVGIGEPEGLVISRDGAIIVADQATNRILEISYGSGRTKVLRQLVNNTGKDGVDGLAIDTLSGDILIPDSPNGRLLRMSRDGTSLATIATGFVRPTGAAVEMDGSILVVDEFGNAIYRIHRDGSRTRLASLFQPDDVIVSPNGTIYANSLGGEIRSIDPVSGKMRVLMSGLKLPHGLGMDSAGRLVIAEAGRNRIFRLTL